MDFERIPYFELVEGLLEEIQALQRKNDGLEQDLTDKIEQYQAKISKLLLIKETFERRAEVEKLNEDIKLLNEDKARLALLVSRVLESLCLFFRQSNMVLNCTEPKMRLRTIRGKYQS